MAFLSRSVLVAVGCLWWVACSNNYDPGGEDGGGGGTSRTCAQGCLAGEICQDGLCVTGSCTSDAQCPGGLCVNGACQSPMACTMDAECGAGRHCENGACRPNAACTSNASCPSNQHCENGVCTGNATCTSDTNCPASQSCVGGTCTNNASCNDGSDCPASQQCLNGTCTRNNPCSTSMDCPASQSCVGGVCTGNAACAGDADCPASQRCENGSCTRNNACTTNADCPASQSCVSGQCVRNEGCTTDMDCLDTQVCTGGTCQNIPPCVTAADCPMGLVCDRGQCTRSPPCERTMDCPMGQACLNGACTPFVGTATLACPGAPTNVRILDEVTLTVTVTGGVADTYSVRWTVEQVLDSQGNNQANTVALNGANTPSVRFNVVVPGQYRLRATLSQVGATDASCDVDFTVAGPTAAFNAQLLWTTAVDLDLHLLHPVGQANGARQPRTNTNWFYQFNWGPPEEFSCQNNVGLVNCPTLERARVLPDCHFGNCTACTVTVPGQPLCSPTVLAWNTAASGTLTHPDGTLRAYSFDFPSGAAGVPVSANPKLDIDNRRGCYQDALGSTVCIPENISMEAPRNGRYTVAVHYYGAPYVPGQQVTNQRGQPAGAMASANVEIYCRGTATTPQGGFRTFACNNITVDGWCFVTDVVWGPNGCESFETATRTFVP